MNIVPYVPITCISAHHFSLVVVVTGLRWTGFVLVIARVVGILRGLRNYRNARNANALYIKNDGTKKTTVILRRTGVNVRAVRTASTPTPQYAMGDVNHDGVITVIDASLITEYVLGNTPAVFFVANADVNNDGSISVTDVSKIVEIVLGGSGPVTPPTHEYVDLGLTSKTLWATCNVGATSPEGYGNYYAWGETKPKSTYSWATYQYCNGSSSSVVDLGNSIAGTAYDAATANWGSEWVMPTVAQIVELLNQCKLSFATVNGEKGLNLTGPNGKSIFFPMTGYKDGGSLIKAGEQTYLWSSRKDLVNNVAYKSGALYLERTSTSAKTKSTQAERRLGLPIRAVRASSAGARVPTRECSRTTASSPHQSQRPPTMPSTTSRA